MPAASPSSPSTKFMALISATVSTTVSSTPWVSPRMRNEPPIPLPPPPPPIQNTTHPPPPTTTPPATAPRDPERHPLHPGQHQHARRGRLAGQLGDRVEFVTVVEHPDGAEHDHRDEGADDLVRVVEGQPQRRELVGQQHAGQHSPEHREATPARSRRGVHVSVAG